MLKLKLALRYLLKKPITLFAVISVMLGTSAFVLVIGVMNGYVTAFNEISRAFLSDMIVKRASGRGIPNQKLVTEEIKSRVGEITACSPHVPGIAVIKIKSKDGRFSLKWCHFIGVDPASEFEVARIEVLKKVPPGSDDWIILGKGILGNLSPDDVKSLTLVAGSRTGDSTTPPIKERVKLAGVLDLGLHDYDKKFAYVSRRLAARLVGSMSPDPASEIRIRIKEPGESKAVSKDLQAVLKDMDVPTAPLIVMRYQETSGIFRALKLQRDLAGLLLGCLFAASGFAVVAICFMIVYQKTRDIGVLRTIGLSRSGVMGIFVTYGVVSAMVGVALGLTFGIFVLDHMEWVRQTLTGILGHDPFPMELYHLESVPHEVSPMVLLLIVAIAFVVSVLGSLYPAFRAARLNAVESLRYE